MSTITLPNIRVSSDLTIRLKLKDGGVAIDWSTLQNIRVSLYADDQRSMASRCSVSIDEEDSTILVCQYAANKMQYLGVNRVIVQCKYMGEVKTYDKPAFNFVRWTSDQEGEQITIDDPDVDVEISVEDVSSSILQEAVDAAFSAADRANEAAEEAEHMVDIHTGPAGKSPYIGENGHWYEWDEETNQYVDTETNAKGDTGETPDISIGTVTTVEPGTPAAASMGGTPEAPVLNLSIPKGAVGATPNFTVGTVTTGQPGTPVVITITGTAEAPVLNVTIPQGLKGDTGVSADYPITIHNGLDSDATDEALAAFQGKVLDGKVSQLEAKVTDLETAIDLQEETRTVTKTLVLGTDFTESVGYAPASTGAIVTWNTNFHHSSDIQLPAGGILQVRASGPNTIAVIAKKVSGTTNYEPVTPGTQNAQMRDYSYTATEDCEVVVSWQVSNDMYLGNVTKTATETIQTSAISELQEDMSALQESQAGLEETVEGVSGDVTTVVNDDLTTGLVAGKYITHAGSVVTNASFSYKEFPVRAGAVVVFSATIHQNVAAIAKKRIHTNPASGDVGFIELVPATSTNPETFTYTAEEDMTIVVSFNNTATRSIKITTNNVRANSLIEAEILGGEETYKKALMLQDINFGYMFDKIAVIGDSLASGRVEGIVGQSDAAGRDFYNFSWLSFLSKRWRCSAFKNYSNAGADTASWLTDWLPVMQADSVVYDAYFIALGTNNEYNESDPSGDQANYEAFVERYNDILDAVRAKAPNAVIFILSLYEPRGGYGNATLQEIAETRMATDSGVFYLDFVNETGYFRYSPEVNWRGHFSSVGYVYVASAIARMVNEIIWDNKTEEFWIQFAKYHNGS